MESDVVVLDMQSATHLEGFLIKQGMLFLERLLGVCRGMRMQLHASYAEACSPPNFRGDLKISDQNN